MKGMSFASKYKYRILKCKIYKKTFKNSSLQNRMHSMNGKATSFVTQYDVGIIARVSMTYRKECVQL